MAQRQQHQRGWLKREPRKDGDTWMLYYRTLRESDGKRVEKKIPIGLVREFPSKAAVWQEVERQHLHINRKNFRARVTFADLAQHYIEHELGEQTESVSPKAHTTIGAYKRVLRNRSCRDGERRLHSTSHRWKWSSGCDLLSEQMIWKIRRSIKHEE